MSTIKLKNNSEKNSFPPLTTTIEIEDDFDLEKIKTSGQCFRVCSNEDSVFRFISKDKILYIKSIGEHLFAVNINLKNWQDYWYSYFDLDRNYSRIRRRANGLNEFIDNSTRFGAGLRILRQDLWEMLITFIISQRKSMPAIATSVEAMCTKFGTPLEPDSGNFRGLSNFNSDGILYSFPSAEAIAKATEAELRSCGVGYRAKYIRDTARLVQRGDINLQALSSLDDSSLVEELKHAPGVGDKVANCIALFGYGRTSLVPVDVWIQRVIDEECAGINPFTQYGEYAGLMQQYAFYYMTQRK